MARFAQKRAFVTGASRGIGRAIALALRQEGAYVVGTRTSNGRGEADVCDMWIAADFSDTRELEACAASVRDLGLDILINNAGINKIAPFTEVDANDFLKIQKVNVFAPFLLCKAAIPTMKGRGWGRIVNISSIWGKVGRSNRAAYAASKFALDGLTLALAAEHSVDGILANSVAPGFIDTELTRAVLGKAGISTMVAQVPVGRVGTAEEVARLVLWLASGENSYVAGQNFAIDGGFTRV